MSDLQDGAPDGRPAGPPWINDTMQQRVGWRDGDVVVSVPAKCGTTWTMHIVHQLRTGGDPNFTDLYVEVPWLELVPGPGWALDDLVARFDAMPVDRRRAFKTHSAPPTLPFQAPGAGPDVRYLVVGRDPDEAVASFRPFLASHSDAWRELWRVDRERTIAPDFETYLSGFVTHSFAPRLFGFVSAWWPLRHQPNVLFLHYADLKREPEATIRSVADFLGFRVPDERWPAVLEYTSFPWMKAHQEKFELRHAADLPMLGPGAMIRKGRLGASSDDGITPEASETIAGVGRSILTDPEAWEWCYHGGPLPA